MPTAGDMTWDKVNGKSIDKHYMPSQRLGIVIIADEQAAEGFN